MSRAHLHLPNSVGERAADAIATFTGSWRFILSYIAATGLWCLGNLLSWSFDPYPYQFYTFSVSVLAILLSAVILLSQNRAAIRDAARDDLEAQEVEAMYGLLQQLHTLNQTQLEILELLRPA